jgi:hypothetical protein
LVSVNHLLDIVREKPNLVPDIVTQTQRLSALKAELETAKIGVATVLATGKAETGIRVEPGWAFRVDALEGEWTAKANSSEYPIQKGQGYPSYQPGFFGDYRTCPKVALGAILGSVGSTCAGAGDWYRYQGPPNLLVLSMNDTIPGDNAGQIKVRYAVRKPRDN